MSRMGRATIIALNLDNELREKFQSNRMMSSNDLATEYFKKYPENTTLIVWKKYIAEYLGLKRTKEERNEIRRIKSLNPENNPDYKVKYDVLNAIENSEFKTVDNLVEFMNETGYKYQHIVDNYLGNKEDNYISARALEKIIIVHPNYKKRQSLEESTFVSRVRELLPDFSDEFSLNNRKAISPKEVDIYIQSLKIAIEFNGDYWHSDQMCFFNHGKSSYEVHKEKAELAKKKGIKLIYVWEKDWFNDEDRKKIEQAIATKDFENEILNKYSVEPIKEYHNRARAMPLNRLNKKLIRLGADKKYKRSYNLKKGELHIGNLIIRQATPSDNLAVLEQYKKQNKEVFTIFPWNDYDKIEKYIVYKLKLEQPKVYYARKLQVNWSSVKDSRFSKFIDENHILGKVPHKNLIGYAYFEDENKEIIGIASFVQHKEGAELKRLVFRYDVSIVGGASRLLAYFRKQFPNLNIVTYSDRNISEGEVYQKLGFTKTAKKSYPQTVYHNEWNEQKFSKASLYLVGADRLLANLVGYEPVGIGEDLPNNEEIVLNYGFQKYEDCGNYFWRLKAV